MSTTLAPDKPRNTYSQELNQARLVNAMHRRGDLTRQARKDAGEAAFASLMRRPRDESAEVATEQSESAAPPREAMLRRLSRAKFLGLSVVVWLAGAALLVATQWAMILLWQRVLGG